MPPLSLSVLQIWSSFIKEGSASAHQTTPPEPSGRQLPPSLLLSSDTQSLFPMGQGLMRDMPQNVSRMFSNSLELLLACVTVEGGTLANPIGLGLAGDMSMLWKPRMVGSPPGSPTLWMSLGCTGHSRPLLCFGVFFS